MIRTSPATIYRAVAIVLAAAVLPFLTPRASAQTSLDLFAGAIPNTVTDPATLSVTSIVALNSNNSATGLFGVTGYSGTVALTNGVINTLSEGFASTNGANAYSIAQSGALTLGGSTTAAKSFGPQLTANTAYTFALTRSNGSAVGLLGSFNIALNNGGVNFVNTATGQGLSGTVDVLGIFGSNGVATFNFTTPANYVPANGFGVTFSGSLPANAAGGVS